MIRTRICDLFGIQYPIALGGLGGGHTRPELVAAVSEAGGFGAQGCHQLTVAQIHDAAAAIRARTTKPFAFNFLMFLADDDCFAAALKEKPAAIALAWPRSGQDLKPYIDRAHDAGCKVTLMAGGVPEAERGVAAGADVIIAQGTEGGGHVGLAAALALGADGVLLGTRFLASKESPLHENFKQAIVRSDGHDTVLTEIPDVAAGVVWPGAMSRAKRNRFVERWAGREWALRQQQTDVLAGVQAARKAGDPDEAPLSFGQDAGLIKDVVPVGDIVRRMAREAEDILSVRLPALIR